MNYLKILADSRGKFANKFRRSRFLLFSRLIGSINSEQKLHILDVGGRIYFWEKMDFIKRQDIEITILNLSMEMSKYLNIKCVVGNGCDMKEFVNNEFDIVFSNSVIEHVEDLKNQEMMAREIQRVGKRFFIQTPNYWFPLEPHFLTLGFQFLPTKAKAFLIRHFNLGWHSRTKDYQQSIKVAKSIRLLRKRELQKFFPEAIIIPEKFFGLVKSFIVYKW